MRLSSSSPEILGRNSKSRYSSSRASETQGITSPEATRSTALAGKPLGWRMAMSREYWYRRRPGSFGRGFDFLPSLFADGFNFGVNLPLGDFVEALGLGFRPKLLERCLKLSQPAGAQGIGQQSAFGLVQFGAAVVFPDQ